MSQITLNDRCDRCSAQAYVLVRLETGGELYFCAHHAHKHDEVLRLIAIEWIDETGRLKEDAATR